MDTSDVIAMPEAHENIITDLRFNPCSSNVAIFATSSSDQTVRVWDAATVSCYLSLSSHLVDFSIYSTTSTSAGGIS